jgi:hypothetical protein
MRAYPIPARSLHDVVALTRLIVIVGDGVLVTARAWPVMFRLIRARRAEHDKRQ